MQAVVFYGKTAVDSCPTGLSTMRRDASVLVSKWGPPHTVRIIEKGHTHKRYRISQSRKRFLRGGDGSGTFNTVTCPRCPLYRWCIRNTKNPKYWKNENKGYTVQQTLHELPKGPN